MPSYVILGNFTEQGIKDIKGVKGRVAATKQALEQAGGRMIAYYLTLGAYDFLSIVEVPDAETGARVLLSLGAQGNVRTTTMQAFTEEETFALADSI
jgi:uncharacterized protein with GYD domain